MVDVLLYLEQFQTDGAWFALCLLAGFASILIYGIFYSIGHAFMFDDLKKSSKAEILQGFATLFIVIFLIVTLSQVEEFAIKTFLGTDSYVLCGGDEIHLSTIIGGQKKADIKKTIEIVECRFTERAKEIAEIQDAIYDKADSSNIFAKLTATVTFAGIIIYQGNWVDSYFQEAEQYRVMNAFLTVVLIGANSLTSLVRYISFNMLSVFLPFGLFLRTFKYTRGIGALFISLAIGLYFIFPVLFVMTDPGFVEVPEIPATPAVNPQTVFCLPTFSGTVTQMQAQGTSEISMTSILSTSRSSIAQFYSYMTLHAFVVFSITIVFIRYMMFILGGDAYDILRFVSKVV
ncbi:MAG: hypothetical protein PHU63_01715 [Candidatus ainarchaeum sp.]|nr:hypothetical protein [Candidatus ainarchaeum sp.]